MQRLVFVALAAVAAGGCCSSSLTIAERGRPAAYSVVLPEKPSPSEQYAAEEFRDWTEKLTGVRLAIVTNVTPAKAVYLNPERPDEALGIDGFRLTTRGENVCVSGGSRGVLYGVYELLETYGGITWLTADMTDVPASGALEVPKTLCDVQKPAFARRNHDWNQLWSKPAFECRSRLNNYARDPKYGGKYPAFDPMFNSCHTFGRLLDPEKLFDEHPEYFSMVKGKRLKSHTQLCMTNPDVRRLITEMVVKRIRYNQKFHPEIRYYGISQNDWNNYCECPDCAAIDAREGSHSGALIHFINQIAEEVEKVDPTAVVETLAYMYSRRPPKSLKPRHNVMPMLCSIECDFSKSMATSRFKENADFREDVEKWRAISKHLMIWDYTADWRGTPCPHGNFDALKGNAAYFRDNGVTELFYEGWSERTPSTEFCDLKGWLSGKFLWNPDQPLQPLLDRFCRGYYGKGAPYVLQYIDLLRKQPIDETKTPFTYARFIEDKPYTDAFLAEGARLWHVAESVVAGSDPQVVSNVFWGTFGLDYARVAMYMHRKALWKPIVVSRQVAAALDRKEYDEMKALARQLDKTIRAHSPKEVMLSSRLHDFRAKGFVSALAESSFPEGASVDKSLIQEWATYYPDFPPSKTTFREADPEATNGRAIHVRQPAGSWHLHCPFRQLVAVDTGATYRLRARVKIPAADAKKTKSAIASLGIYSYTTKKSLGSRTVKPSDATGRYVWLDIGDWTAEDDNVVVHVSPTDCSEFFFDCLEIERVK